MNNLNDATINCQDQDHHRQGIITQYRCSDPTLQKRVINPKLYNDHEMEWFADPNLILPEPMRLVMIQAYRCYLCGEMQSSGDTIHQENAGEHPYGYRYCTDCKPYFRKGLFNQIAPLWRLRLQYEEPLASGGRYERTPVWIARTRYDANGARIRTGSAPYLYTQWTIVRWIPTKYVDKYRLQHDPTYVGYDYSLIAESLSPEPLTKLVSVKDLFIINYGSIANPAAYDPNVDDPLNKYSDSEKTQMFELARDAAIFI